MPKRKICDNQGCNNITHGKLCKPCDLEKRKANRKYDTRFEYSKSWALQKKYGITLEEYDAYWIVFKGKCGICNINLKRPEPTKGQELNAAALDHDHKTGNIRGLLCNGCNKALGLFKDNPEILKNAINWVKYNEKNGNNQENT
jgi:hypothetical protein